MNCLNDLFDQSDPSSERVGGARRPPSTAHSAVIGRLHEALAADWSVESSARGVGGAYLTAADRPQAGILTAHTHTG